MEQLQQPFYWHDLASFSWETIFLSQLPQDCSKLLENAARSSFCGSWVVLSLGLGWAGQTIAFRQPSASRCPLCWFSMRYQADPSTLWSPSVWIWSSKTTDSDFADFVSLGSANAPVLAVKSQLGTRYGRWRFGGSEGWSAGLSWAGHLIKGQSNNIMNTFILTSRQIIRERNLLTTQLRSKNEPGTGA